jgi:hypothetical protein
MPLNNLSEAEELELLELEKEQASLAGKRRSPLEMVGRQVGLTARAGIEGVASLPLAITDAPVTVKRAFGMPSGKKGSEVLSEGLTKAGLPEAETGTERFSLAAIPMLLGGGGGAAGGKNLVTGPMQTLGRDLMQSALKPTLKQLKSGEAAVAIDTMLQKGINATKGGVGKLKDEIGRLNDEIKQIIADSPATVDKARAARELNDLTEKFSKQVNPQADTAAIRKVWQEFRDHPLIKDKIDIPIQLAQELKQGTYKQLSKKYGELGSAEVEAQKTLARGLKEGVAEAEPRVAALNAEESKLIKTLNVAERRALLEMNKNPVGFAWLSHNPASWAAFMADKSALFKSLAARMLYSSAQPMSRAVGAGAGISLSGLSKLTTLDQAQ